MAKFTHKGCPIEIDRTERGYRIKAGTRRELCKHYFENYDKAHRFVIYNIDRAIQFCRYPLVDGFKSRVNFQ